MLGKELYHQKVKLSRLSGHSSSTGFQVGKLDIQGGHLFIRFNSECSKILLEKYYYLLVFLPLEFNLVMLQCYKLRSLNRNAGSVFSLVLNQKWEVWRFCKGKQQVISPTEMVWLNEKNEQSIWLQGRQFHLKNILLMVHYTDRNTLSHSLKTCITSTHHTDKAAPILFWRAPVKCLMSYMIYAIISSTWLMLMHESPLNFTYFDSGFPWPNPTTFGLEGGVIDVSRIASHYSDYSFTDRGRKQCLWWPCPLRQSWQIDKTPIRFCFPW